MNVMLILTTLVLAAGPPATAPPSGATPADEHALPAADHDLQRLLDELGHPRFDVRQAATEKLCELDPQHLPLLVERYRTEPRYEMKRRIRYVIENIFLRPLIAGRDGFLGIRVVEQLLSNVQDPQTGKPVHGLIVAEVIAGHAAERGGLKSGDLIVSLNGQPLPEDGMSTSFIKLVSGTPPGTNLSLRVLRAEVARQVEVPPAKPDPPALPERGKALEGARRESTPLGVRVVEVVPGSPAAELGLKPNDLIRAINGKELTSPTTGTTDLDRELATARMNDPLTLRVLDPAPINLEVTLGSRPVEMMQAVDWRQAQARFIQWWQDQGGDLSPRPAESASGTVFFRQAPQILIVPETSLIP